MNISSDNETISKEVTQSDPKETSLTSETHGEKKQAQTSLGGLTWVEQYQGIAIGLAFVLMFLYTAPIYMISLAAWKTDIFQEPTFLLSWFAAFMKSSDTTLNGFHKVLLPVISGLSVIVFRAKPTKAMLALGLFILFSFVLTIAIAVVFDMESTQTALSGLGIPIKLELVKAFFTRIQETLLMYFMILIGISVTNAGK